MISEKRTRNAPERFFIKNPSTNPKAKTLDKRYKLSEDNYTIIGLPVKYLGNTDVYLLPGNIPFTMRDDVFVTELSWLNEFHTFREVQIMKNENEKTLIIQAERRNDSRFPRLYYQCIS